MNWYWMLIIIMCIILICAIAYTQSRIDTLESFIQTSCLTYADLVEMNKINGTR
jgi:hypothetical protein